MQTCVGDDRSRVFTTEVFALSLQDDEVRRGWTQFYDSVREMYVGLVLALHANGATNVASPRQAVNLMLAAIEGIKMQAAIAPGLDAPDEQQLLVDGLFGIVTAENGIDSPWSHRRKFVPAPLGSGPPVKFP